MDQKRTNYVEKWPILVLSRRFQRDFSLHDIMNQTFRPVVNNPEMALTI